MAVKLSVIEAGSRQHQRWWVNFCLAEVKLVDDGQNYDHPLSNWGGKMRPGSCIEFENDADATAFLLRWA
jgi:hypothetical protein